MLPLGFPPDTEHSELKIKFKKRLPVLKKHGISLRGLGWGKEGSFHSKAKQLNNCFQHGKIAATVTVISGIIKMSFCHR